MTASALVEIFMLSHVLKKLIFYQNSSFTKKSVHGHGQARYWVKDLLSVTLNGKLIEKSMVLSRESSRF